MKIRSVCWAPEKSRSIARAVSAIRSSNPFDHLPPAFPARKFVCVLFSCTICPSKLRTIDSAFRRLKIIFENAVKIVRQQVLGSLLLVAVVLVILSWHILFR